MHTSLLRAAEKLLAANCLLGTGRVGGCMVSATFELMSSSLSKGFKSKKPQRPVICRVFCNCLRMRRWSGRRLDSWNGMRKLLWFSTFKAALSTPTRFQTLWSLRTKLKNKKVHASAGFCVCLSEGNDLGSILDSACLSQTLSSKWIRQVQDQPTEGFLHDFAFSLHPPYPRDQQHGLCSKSRLFQGFDGTDVNSRNSWIREGCKAADFGPPSFSPPLRGFTKLDLLAIACNCWCLSSPRPASNRQQFLHRRGMNYAVPPQPPM